MAQEKTETKIALMRSFLDGSSFWNAHPALLIAISFLFGGGSFLFWNGPWKYLVVIVWGLYLTSQKAWPSLLLMIGASFYSSAVCTSPQSAERGLFSIHSLQPHVSPFHKGLVYKGTLYLEHSSIPCSVYYKGSEKERPLANCNYILTGTLLNRDGHSFSFKAEKWEKIPSTFSLAEMRYSLKNRFKRYLENHLSSGSASFLSSLTTGDVEDRMLRFEFNRLGLAHLLCISGFHFAILVSLCSFICRAIFPKKQATLLLAFFLTLYFLFVGASPAVQRSWLAAMLYLAADFFNRNSSPLNLLGFAALFEFLIDPRTIGQIGFQLSYLSTAGILLFSSPIDRLLQHFIPKRSYREASLLSFKEKWVCLVAKFLRSALSLNLAVNLSILPLLLYHFHQFPYLSLLYNLFIPALVGLALFSLCFCFLVPDFFPICDFLTGQILDLVSNPLIILDFSLRSNRIEAWMVPFYLVFLLIFTIGLTKEEHYSKISPLCNLSARF